MACAFPREAMFGKGPAGAVPARQAPGSVNRGEQEADGASEREASVLPGRTLTETRQPVHVSPDPTGIRLVAFSQVVRLRSLFPTE